MKCPYCQSTARPRALITSGWDIVAPYRRCIFMSVGCSSHMAIRVPTFPRCGLICCVRKWRHSLTDRAQSCPLPEQIDGPHMEVIRTAGSLKHTEALLHRNGDLR
jgi:hypothetical protein